MNQILNLEEACQALHGSSKYLVESYLFILFYQECEMDAAKENTKQKVRQFRFNFNQIGLKKQLDERDVRLLDLKLFNCVDHPPSQQSIFHFNLCLPYDWILTLVMRMFSDKKLFCNLHFLHL